MQKNAVAKIIICSVFFILTGCNSDQADVVGKTNTLNIIGIQPPVTQVLKHDQKVDVEARIGYVLESKAATVTLAILRTEGFGNKTLSSTFRIIQKGKGELVLKESFFVPETDALELRVLLLPQQRNDTAPEVKLNYKVVQ